MSWAEIKKAVNSDLSKPLNELIGEGYTELSSLKSLLGEANPTTLNRLTVMNYLKILENAIANESVIKKIQRGTVVRGYIDTTASKTTREISISSVNVSKSILISETQFTAPTSERYAGAGLMYLTTSKIVQDYYWYDEHSSSTRYHYNAASWQVIEFY